MSSSDTAENFSKSQLLSVTKLSSFEDADVLAHPATDATTSRAAAPVAAFRESFNAELLRSGFKGWSSSQAH
jgi:hypothetical protein